MTRQEKEDAAELQYKGNYCQHTAPNGSIDHGVVQSVAFWNGEYIVMMNNARITIEEGELQEELKVLTNNK